MMINSELVRRYEKFFGKDETKKLLQTGSKIRNDTYIRINLSKTSKEEVIKFLNKNRVKYSLTPISNCIKIEKTFFNLSSSLLSLKGHIYIQDIASQIPVNCIDLTKYKKVKILDMAAAPGSKTTQIADVLTTHNIDYEIIALEPEKKRLTKLINNIQKQSLKNIKVLNIKGQEILEQEKFDIIFLDAPCSGNLAGDRNWLTKRNLEGIKKMSQIQKELLEKASKIIKENSLIIYSTCSLEPEENEDNIKWAKEKLNLTSITPDLNLPFSTKTMYGEGLRLMPAKTNTQGFFVCILKKG